MSSVMIPVLFGAFMLQGSALPTSAQVPATHPASPAAVQAPLPALSNTLAIPATDSAKKDVVVYTCPMDPDVVRNEPGNCPKCGMKLVVKKVAKDSTKKDSTKKEGTMNMPKSTSKGTPKADSSAEHHHHHDE